MKNIADFDMDMFLQMCENGELVNSVKGHEFRFKTVDEIRQDWLSFFDEKKGHRVDGVPDNFDDYLEQVLAVQEKYRKEHGVKC